MSDNLSLSPGLFGQAHSSRNYADPKVWGKNQFNSSFPASLVAYMSSKDILPVYVCIDEYGNVVHKPISGTEILGIDPLSDNAYYDFEAGYTPFETYYKGDREKIDLVMVDRATGQPLRGLEIKLTALPDNSTRRGSEDEYSCEIVVRPPTICFLACSICKHYSSEEDRNRLKCLLGSVPQINHWEEMEEIEDLFSPIQEAVLRVCKDMQFAQTPLIVQPVWKSDKNGASLAEDCLDVFVWSNLATVQLCVTDVEKPLTTITRAQRAIVWIYKMLFDYSIYGQFDYTRIIKLQSYNTANDKAFALNGQRTFPFLSSPELRHPRIKKQDIKHIILGGGQDFLSPERRFDAVIVNTPNLFD